MAHSLEDKKRIERKMNARDNDDLQREGLGQAEARGIVVAAAIAELGRYFPGEAITASNYEKYVKRL